MKNYVGRSIWRVVDSHWSCIDSTCQQSLVGMSLCVFLDFLGINLPDYLMYGLFYMNDYHVKYRHYGGQITIYVSLNNSKDYVQSQK